MNLNSIPVWQQFLYLLGATFVFYGVGFYVAGRFPPNRWLFKKWYWNLLTLTVALYLVVTAVATFAAGTTQAVVLLLGPGFAFGLSYGMVQRDIPQAQRRPTPNGTSANGKNGRHENGGNRKNGAAAQSRSSSSSASIASARRRRLKKKRRPGPSR